MRSRKLALALLVGFAALFALGVRSSSQDARVPLVPTAGERADVAKLTFEIRDENDRPMPGRLTFLDDAKHEPALFTDKDPASGVLAVRRNVVYTLGPRVTITVPAGTYTIFATRGPEWSLAQRSVVFEAGRDYEWSPSLRHELDTPGWASADFHLHTYTHSGHGDANLNERIVSLIGEGVEFAVATDHNKNIDYQPTLRALGVSERITAITGDEVSTDIGHFNAFPLDPKRAPIDSTPVDAHVLFASMRAETNAFSVAPIVQVNHPRYADIDYFGHVHFDPITGRSSDPNWSPDFDAVEILNANPMWGYDEPGEVTEHTGPNLHSVLVDWFHLLNRGARYAAVGNSDSHTVTYDFAGYPRNYVGVDDSNPGALDPRQVAAAVRARKCFTTSGPFLDVLVEGREMGSDVQTVASGPRTGKAKLEIRARSASWISFDRVRVFLNGDLLWSARVDPNAHAFETTLDLAPRADAWVVVTVDGSGDLAPVAIASDRPVRPIAIGNPIWIDADRDGKWTAPAARIEAAAKSLDERALVAEYSSATPWERALWLDALVVAKPAFARRLIPGALEDQERCVRLAAARAAEAAHDPSYAPVLDAVGADALRDSFFGLAVLRARIASGGDGPTLANEFLVDHDDLDGRTVRRELVGLAFERFVDDWSVIGYFPAGKSPELGPERDADTTKSWPGKANAPVAWEPRRANAHGYVSLLAIGGAAASERSVDARAFAQTWLWSPDERTIAYTLGTDDGCRVRLGETLLYADPASKGADPWEHLGRVAVAAGWNRLVFDVVNGSGDFGLYFRVFDPELRWSATRDEAVTR
ncbi:MAG: CehA/McbA family metallohydrolase [Planctomycetes bacterium]|nr:CehA/McbA family metallohydrolase [Planctomycetota bacterium]